MLYEMRLKGSYVIEITRITVQTGSNTEGYYRVYLVIRYCYEPLFAHKCNIAQEFKSVAALKQRQRC